MSSDKEHIERMIGNCNCRLKKLREQQALEGFSIDPKISIEIEKIVSEIGKLQTELMELEDNSVDKHTNHIQEVCIHLHGSDLLFKGLKISTENSKESELHTTKQVTVHLILLDNSRL